MHTGDAHSRDMHTRDMHTRDTHPRNTLTRDTYTRDIHARDTRTRDLPLSSPSPPPLLPLSSPSPPPSSHLTTSRSYVGSGSTSGKQAHMASAVEELSRIMPSHVITRGTTLLIDDDANNIKVALAEGVRAIWLNPKNSDKLLQNVTELLM